MRLAIAAALTGALLLCGAPADAQRGLTAPPDALDLRPGETLLEVEATGFSFHPPTVMRVEAGVISTGPTALAALEANSTQMNAVIEAVRAFGIEARDIQTSELTVQPRFAEDYDPRSEYQAREQPRILGYVATNKLELRLRSIDRASNIIGALFGAGANYVDGPRFSIELSMEPQAIEAARRDAVRYARIQAESYAQAFGLRVARVIRISERESQVDVGNRITVTGARNPTTPIEPGEIEVELRLWVDYALVAQ